ncbi:MAG: ATP-binding cassette domain-containing protein [Lawsonibacter sp.]
MNKVLELEEVSRTFSSGVFRTHTVRAVDRVSFALERGKTFGLVGNSGCGKTTLLPACITASSKLLRGRIRFEGRTSHAWTGRGAGRTTGGCRSSSRIRRPPGPLHAHPGQSAGGHGHPPAGESREERMEKIRAALGQVGLPDYLLSRYPTRSARGEGQRLVICRALLLEPEVLLLDEPTSMLDVSVQASIMNLLRELQERLGLTYLYITHDIELLGWISHTIGVMQRGRLVEVGSRDQVMEAPVHPYTRELLYSYTHWEGGGET